ncbi:hypothetical protein MML63_16205 [Kosakonia sacchari]|uniref:hypothetical protein n=1 Tax=Kosakonia sacchari TaxID=1158459 RepID=UPI0025B0FF14|nr:hypothetical protein [Kosakonia sacchari]MDN2487174.1 hypothetical protein [Kosakonia sacchari]
MSLLTSLFGHKKPRLTDLQLNIAGWQLYESHDTSMAWSTPEQSAVRLQLHAPVQWPFALHDIAAAKHYWQQETAKIGGALLELTALTIQGVAALQGTFKYRDPTPGSLGMYFVAIIWLPVKHGLFQINAEAVEKGNTGFREAVVMDLQLKQGNIPPVYDEPEFIDSADALFAKLRESELRCLPSDDRQYDEMFPEHPLSQVRRTIALCAQHTQLAKHVRQ